MNSQAPAILVVLPLIASFCAFFTGWWKKESSYAIAVGALAGCLALACNLLFQLLGTGPFTYRMGGWEPPWGIEYRIDHLAVCMVLLITSLCLVTAIYANRLVKRELRDKASLFWCLYLLLTTGLLGIVLTADLFNLFVLLEVASLSSYTLVAMGRERAQLAGFRYLLMGTLGATFYLIGIGYLYIATGSLNMQDLRGLLSPLYDSRVVRTAFVFIFFGLGLKTALFPLHAWLPDAYTYAPNAVSALLAPLMTKVMAYAVIRVMFTVFTAPFAFAALWMDDILVWAGALAIFFGALTALSQSDYRRMLSYVIIAEIGYIIGGIGIANATALKGAIFHIVNDALMMACLFLVGGMVSYQTNGHGISNFRGIFRSAPITASIFVVGALAIIGVPPTCGFFSKWYLLLGALSARQWPFVAALLICTLINVALFFRIIDKGLFVHHRQPAPNNGGLASGALTGEAPLSMLLPASVVALAILLVGLFNQLIVNHLIRYTVPPGF